MRDTSQSYPTLTWAPAHRGSPPRWAPAGQTLGLAYLFVKIRGILAPGRESSRLQDDARLDWSRGASGHGSATLRVFARDGTGRRGPRPLQGHAGGGMWGAKTVQPQSWLPGPALGVAPLGL